MPCTRKYLVYDNTKLALSLHVKRLHLSVWCSSDVFGITSSHHRRVNVSCGVKQYSLQATPTINEWSFVFDWSANSLARKDQITFNGKMLSSLLVPAFPLGWLGRWTFYAIIPLSVWSDHCCRPTQDTSLRTGALYRTEHVVHLVTPNSRTDQQGSRHTTNTSMQSLSLSPADKKRNKNDQRQITMETRDGDYEKKQPIL